MRAVPRGSRGMDAGRPRAFQNRISAICIEGGA